MSPVGCLLAILPRLPCTEPFFYEITQNPPAPGSLVGLARPLTCSGDWPIVDVFRFGDPLPPGVERYHLDPDGTCKLYSASGDYDFALIPEEDPSIFARAELVTEARGEELEIEILLGADSSKQLGRTLDHGVVACGASPLHAAPLDELGYCLPVNIAAPPCDTCSAEWADPACTKPSVQVNTPPPGCPDPEYALMPTAETYELRQVGERVTKVYFDVEGGGCASTSQSNYYRFFTVDELVEVTAFPVILRRGLGTGRLRAPLIGSPDEQALASHYYYSSTADGNFFDLDYQSFCSPWSFADGVARCVPEAALRFGFVYFADPGCSVPLVEYKGIPYYAHTEASYTVSTVLPAVEPFMGPAYTWGGCVVDLDAPELWSLGDPVDFDEAFAVVTERVE